MTFSVVKTLFENCALGLIAVGVSLAHPIKVSPTVGGHSLEICVCVCALELEDRELGK